MYISFNTFFFLSFFSKLTKNEKLMTKSTKNEKIMTKTTKNEKKTKKDKNQVLARNFLSANVHI